MKAESLVADQSASGSIDENRDANRQKIGNGSAKPKVSLGKRKPLQVAGSNGQINSSVISKRADSRSAYYTVLYTKKAQKVRNDLRAMYLAGVEACIRNHGSFLAETQEQKLPGWDPGG